MQTLEDILRELGSTKPFLNEVIINEDGTREPFTKSGNKAYSKLIEIIYAVGDLTNRDMNDIVEELDNITAQRFITNSFGRNIVSEIIEYAYEHQNVSLDQFAYFVSDLLPEVEFLEVARFCSDDMLTDTTLVLLDRKDG